jgi:hypothetical protein
MLPLPTLGEQGSDDNVLGNRVEQLVGQDIQLSQSDILLFGSRFSFGCQVLLIGTISV